MVNQQLVSGEFDHIGGKKKEKAVEALVSIVLSWDNARTSGALRRVQILDMAFAIKVKIIEGGWRYAVKRLHGSLWLVVPDRSYEQSCPSPHVLVSGLSSESTSPGACKSTTQNAVDPSLTPPPTPNMRKPVRASDLREF